MQEVLKKVESLKAVATMSRRGKSQADRAEWSLIIERLNEIDSLIRCNQIDEACKPFRKVPGSEVPPGDIIDHSNDAQLVEEAFARRDAAEAKAKAKG